MIRKAPAVGIRTVVLALTIAGFRSSHAEDWPNFQGPDCHGVSAEKGLLKAWPADGPQVLWRTPIGAGYGGPAVVDGKVYMLDRIGKEKDALRCLNLTTGEELWQYAYDAAGELAHDGARSTPTVDTDAVFTIGPFGHVHCIDLSSRVARWKKHLIDDYRSTLPRWGVAHSAVLHGDSVILAPMSKTVGVVALNKKTGEELWRSPPVGDMAYVTPRLATLCGVEQVVVVSATRIEGVPYPTRQPPRKPEKPRGDADEPREVTPDMAKFLNAVSNCVAGIALDDGRLLWRFDEWHCMNPIPTPTPVGDNRVFVTGGYNGGSVMLKITRTGNTFTATPEFRKRELGAQISYPLLYDGYLYFLSNGNFQRNGLVCMAPDGTIKWQTKRAPEIDRGHMVIADGRMVAVNGRDGLLHLIDPGPDGYREISQAAFCKGHELWGPIALSQGKLLVRGDKELWCLELGAVNAEP